MSQSVLQVTKLGNSHREYSPCDPTTVSMSVALPCTFPLDFNWCHHLRNHSSILQTVNSLTKPLHKAYIPSFSIQTNSNHTASHKMERLAVLSRQLTSAAGAPLGGRELEFCPKKMSKFFAHDNFELRNTIYEHLKVGFSLGTEWRVDDLFTVNHKPTFRSSGGRTAATQ